MENKNIKLLTGIIAATMLVGGLGYKTVQAAELRSFNEMKEQEYAQFVEDHKDWFNTEIEYGSKGNVEYGDTFVSLFHIDEIDTMTLGEQTINVELMDADEYIVNFEYNVTIVDTQAPVVEGVTDIELENGDEFDPASLGITAKDPVDGEVDVKFSHEVDTTVDGDYTVTVTAIDKHENKTEETFNVNVYTKPEPVATSSYTHSSSSSSSSSSSYAEPARTDGFNFHGMHFPLVWYVWDGVSVVPADGNVYQDSRFRNHLLIEYFGSVAPYARSIAVGDIVTVNGVRYEIFRKDYGVSRLTGGDLIEQVGADLTFQTCETPEYWSLQTIWFGQAID